MKHRVANRFPDPIRSRMQALQSTSAADELAERIQLMYARIAGKSKVDAQVAYLETLRTWCPFYGSTLYEVDCQYDDNPEDENSTPPVIHMNAWIGPLAIFLLTPTNPPIIMRHPYKRIIKWISLPEKHIFTYWVIKQHVTLADIEEYQEEQRERPTIATSHSTDNTTTTTTTNGNATIDTHQFCDCVYLVTSQVAELEFLVKSYVEVFAGVTPMLPGASDDLLPPKMRPASIINTTSSDEEMSYTSAATSNNHNSRTPAKEAATTSTADAVTSPSTANPEVSKKPRVGRLSLFFSALGSDIIGQSAGTGLINAGGDEEGNNTSGGGGGGGGEDHYGDDTAAVQNSWFKSMYKSDTNTSSHPKKRKSVIEEDEVTVPAAVKYAASMSELKRMAEETQFSDNEGEEDENDEDDENGSDEDNGSDDSGDGGKKRNRNPNKSKAMQNNDSSSDEDNEDDDGIIKKSLPGISSMKAFRRASRILFG
jgi:hypothetical protein